MLRITSVLAFLFAAFAGAPAFALTLETPVFDCTGNDESVLSPYEIEVYGLTERLGTFTDAIRSALSKEKPPFGMSVFVVDCSRTDSGLYPMKVSNGSNEGGIRVAPTYTAYVSAGY